MEQGFAPATSWVAEEVAEGYDPVSLPEVSTAPFSI